MRHKNPYPERLTRSEYYRQRDARAGPPVSRPKPEQPSEPETKQLTPTEEIGPVNVGVIVIPADFNP
jgi:hypothetical protein